MNNSEFYYSVVPLIIINGGFILGYLVFLLTGLGGKRPADLQGRGKSKIILASLQNYWFTITEPFVKFFIKRGITPNTITMMGLGVSLGAGILFGLKLWGAAGWTMVAGGVFDLFDGRVARATGTVSRAGAYLDSVTDRYSDTVLLGGLAYAFKDHWIIFPVLLCFAGFFVVSYAKAKAEAEGVKCNVGTFQRPERIFSLGLSSIFSPIICYYAGWSEQYVLYAAIIVLSIGTVATSIYRVLYTMRNMRTL